MIKVFVKIVQQLMLYFQIIHVHHVLNIVNLDVQKTQHQVQPTKQFVVYVKIHIIWMKMDNVKHVLKVVIKH
jgi:hypothetical protein